MTTLRNANFEFMATIGNILKTLNNNHNVEMENFKMNDEYCDNISLDVHFKNGETARNDFFGFFNSIGYTITEAYGRTNEDYYDEEDYPNGATVIPEVVNLTFNAEIDEVVYEMKYWEVRAK